MADLRFFLVKVAIMTGNISDLTQIQSITASLISVVHVFSLPFAIPFLKNDFAKSGNFMAKTTLACPIYLL